ncbi:MAG: hypothetical protein I3270_01655 [Candidatus Moeniiplasma glomeromycotorum]|nr:hypothetical protein [Candidatus Moeniiplasma glomeromycotorum]MCE8162412.1 hypothetical protein [Candidatus Moeniiplasma glomeromycotorum]MCE8166338.1 hypothetical protein [Candidatus Moeniiplasma glomeromycotorum]MCE8166820.1 hypothetical protein [Candidatus Moeniiplasma glomeromycotorum]
MVNLIDLKIGTAEEGLKRGKRNHFYGSLKSYQNLTKLESICIEATDVDNGLEYLPESLTKEDKEDLNIECSLHNTNAKCKAIQDQLRPFEAWQLFNKQYPNLTKQIQELSQKITQTKTELETTKAQEADKTKKIERLETKLKVLEETKTKLEQELAHEQQQHNQTKANFQSQLRDLATILFPNNSNLNNLSFVNLKSQAEKVKQKETEQEKLI